MKMKTFYHFSEVCKPHTQSSCSIEFSGSGAGVLSIYSISTVVSVEIPCSWRCSINGNLSSSPPIRKLKVLLFKNSEILLSFSNWFTNSFRALLSTR